MNIGVIAGDRSRFALPPKAVGIVGGQAYWKLAARLEFAEQNLDRCLDGINGGDGQELFQVDRLRRLGLAPVLVVPSRSQAPAWERPFREALLPPLSAGGIRWRRL